MIVSYAQIEISNVFFLQGFDDRYVHVCEFRYNSKMKCFRKIKVRLLVSLIKVIILNKLTLSCILHSYMLT